METRVTLWTFVLCAIVSYWCYVNSEIKINYERYIQLVDPDTGVKLKPSELIDLAKIIKPSPEYINSTNAVDRLYDLAHLSTLENSFVIDYSYSNKRDLLVSGWPMANQTRCTNQLDWILEQIHAKGNYSLLRGRLGYDLTKFVDSFGRPESGLFSGSIHWLGSYKNCLSTSLDGGQIKTRYCMVKMRFKSWPQEENIYPATRIRVGVCLPETCDTLSYESLKEQIDQLIMLEMPPRYRDELESDAMFCLPDERSPLRRIPVGGRVFLSVICVWLAIVLVATLLYESKVRPRELAHKRNRLNFVGLQDIAKSCPGNNELPTLARRPIEAGEKRAKKLYEQIICALSIRESIKELKSNTFRVRYRHGERVRLNLSGLDAVKVMLTFLIILIHAGLLTSSNMRSLANRVEINTTGMANLCNILSNSKIVDIYFLFFGVLTSYNLLKKFNERQLSNPLIWLAINIGILIRIAPLFMLTYWYSKLISPYTESGPWWDYGVDHRTLKGMCLREPWWMSIPHFGWLSQIGMSACNPPSWFIASYSQLSLIMPLITYLIYKLPPGPLSRFALVGTLLLTSVSCIVLRLAKQTSVREEGFTIYGTLIYLIEKFELTSYYITLGRLGTVAVGCLVGYLLLRYEQMQITRWPWWVTSLFVDLSCLMLLILIGIWPWINYRIYRLTGRIATFTEVVGIYFISHILWPILCSVILISWTSYHNSSAFTRFMSHSFWHSFNRLGLAIFLIHWEVIMTVVTSFEQASSYGFSSDIMKTWAYGVLFSVFIAIIIYVLIEAPISNLLMIFYRRLSRAQLETKSLRTMQAQNLQPKYDTPLTNISCPLTQ